MVVAWLVLAVLLVLFELHHLAFYALFGAVGALAAAGVAVVAPSAYGAQAGVAVGVALVGVVGVRPFVSQFASHRRGGQVARGVHGGLTGEQALTLDIVGAPHQVGHVRLAGERWLAVSGDDTPIAPGTSVVVTAVQGTTLVVFPMGDDLDGAGLDPTALGSGDPGSVPRDKAPDGADGSTK